MRLIGIYSYYDLIVKAAVRDAGGAKIRSGGDSLESEGDAAAAGEPGRRFDPDLAELVCAASTEAEGYPPSVRRSPDVRDRWLRDRRPCDGSRALRASL
jgi:hypothetical protein